MSEIKIKQNKIYYGLLKFLANTVAKIKFKRKYLRNEIKDKKGPYVVISNHEAALDFVNLIGATSQPMNFVISNSFYQTIPVKKIMPKLGLIPKQQFQTTLSDIRKMKHVVENDGILVIYPCGLMSDDGVPSPLPVDTYKFLQWLQVDVYMAKNIGTYFSMPKWRKGGIRTGKTYIDIYKLFDKEELTADNLEYIRKKTDEALEFDAYREQEEHLIKYKNNSNIEGLENVLYICPNCKKEFTVKTKDENVIYCEACGFAERADEYQFLHKISEVGEEIRYPSDWNKFIHSYMKENLDLSEAGNLTSAIEIQMIPDGKRRFEKVGEGNMTLTANSFVIDGVINGDNTELTVSTACFASLPYKPGAYIEIQNGNDIYRCFPKDGKMVIKFIDKIKIIYEEHCKHCSEHREHSECHVECRIKSKSEAAI